MNEFVIKGEEHKFQAIANAQLAENAGDVVLYGLFADGKPLRNLFIGATGYDGSDNLTLPMGKPEIRG